MTGVMIPLSMHDSVIPGTFYCTSQYLIKEYSPEFVDIHHLLPWKGKGVQAGVEVTNVQVTDTDGEVGDGGNSCLWVERCSGEYETRGETWE